MALSNHLQLHRRLPARDQHHPGDPRGVERHRRTALLIERILIRADGAARGNPGPAAAGAVLIDLSREDAYAPDCPPVGVVSRALGIQTNNYAEYTAVALALEKARSLGAREVELVLDSLLVVEQLSGRWKVKHPQIKPLVARVHAVLAGFERWTVRHERRASNVAADALANLALDDPAAALAAEHGSASTPTAGAALPSETVGRAAIGAACAIFDAQHQILLVRHTYGRSNWELPGGAALKGESPIQTATRELREETALELEGGRLTGVYFEPAHDFGPMLHFVFRFDSQPDLAPVAQAPEIDRLDWWSIDKLPTPISDFTELRIRDALAGEPVVAVIGSRNWR